MSVQAGPEPDVETLVARVRAWPASAVGASAARVAASLEDAERVERVREPWRPRGVLAMPRARVVRRAVLALLAASIACGRSGPRVRRAVLGVVRLVLERDAEPARE